MAIHCSVCAVRLHDATENYGGFPTTQELIVDTCLSCYNALAEAITQAALAIGAAKKRWQRGKRFNDTCGPFGYWTAQGEVGGNHHPDRCVCQKDDTTPHKHYDRADDPKHSCARCSECKGYTPALEA